MVYTLRTFKAHGKNIVKFRLFLLSVQLLTVGPYSAILARLVKGSHYGRSMLHHGGS